MTISIVETFTHVWNICCEFHTCVYFYHNICFKTQYLYLQMVEKLANNFCKYSWMICYNTCKHTKLENILMYVSVEMSKHWKKSATPRKIRLLTNFNIFCQNNEVKYSILFEKFNLCILYQTLQIEKQGKHKRQN